jgi:hypothetical protein
MSRLTRSPTRRLVVAATILALTGLALARAPSVSASPVSASSARSGDLHVTKECSQFTGMAESFCTITSSNLPAITVGSRIVYLQAAGATVVDSDVVLVVGPGDFALGHVVLSRVTHLGVITFSGGTGKFTWFHARIAVKLDPSVAFGWFWNGDYRFSPGKATQESSPVSGSARSGGLSLTKDCSLYTGLADSFCPIVSSNFLAITVSSREVALQAASATVLDSDIVLVVGPGDFVLGHVVLNRLTHLGVITFSGGTGEFRWFHARAVVIASTKPVSESGHYRFDPGQETKES